MMRIKILPVLKTHCSSAGFTLVELLVVISILILLSLAVSISYTNYQQRVSLDSQIATITAQLENQQIKAMISDTSPDATVSAYGVYVATDRLILFKGESYNPQKSGNIPIVFDKTIRLLPSLPSNQIVFSLLSGEVASYSASANSITVKSTLSNRQEKITINPLGVVEVSQ